MTEPAQPAQSNISKQAIHGTFWSYLSFLSGKGLTFLTTVILARLLVPEQFGLVGYCTIAIQYLDIINGAGIDSALISRRDKVQEAANAAFVVNILMGLASFGLAWAAAPNIALFFKAPEVTELFRVLSIVLPISGLGLVPDAMIQRSLRFKIRLIPDIGRNLMRGVVSIALAAAGFGVWSLVWGQIAGDITGAALSWLLAGWRPTLAFDRQATREMLIYGGHIIGIELFGALRSNIDYLFVGRLLGAAALGYYTLAYRIPELVIRNLNSVVSRVSFPILAQVQSDVEQLRSIYFGYIRYIALFTFPAGVGLAVIAPLFIRTFFTAEWEPAIVVMQLISIAIGISSIGFVPGVLYKAINRPEILNRLSMIKLPLVIGVLWYCTRWGIAGVAGGQVLLAIAYTFIDSFVVSRIVQFGLGEMPKALAPALAGAIVMGLTVTFITLAFSPSGIVGLILQTAIGVAAYIGALALVSQDTVLRAYTTLRSAFVRS